MKNREDEMFEKVLEVMKIKRTKAMYHRATLPHKCTLCLEDNQEVGYALNREYVETLNTPYLYICKECYEELKDE